MIRSFVPVALRHNSLSRKTDVPPSRLKWRSVLSMLSLVRKRASAEGDTRPACPNAWPSAWAGHHNPSRPPAVSHGVTEL